MVKKKKGIIVNLSSMSKLRPIKYLQLYGASKSFINYFSEAISYEYEKDGIIIQVCDQKREKKIALLFLKYPIRPNYGEFTLKIRNTFFRVYLR